MNTKQSKAKAFDAKILATKRKEADHLVESMVDLIMQNTWLAAEVTRRWLNKNGYYMTPKAEADKELARKLELVRLHKLWDKQHAARMAAMRKGERKALEIAKGFEARMAK